MSVLTRLRLPTIVLTVLSALVLSSQTPAQAGSAARKQFVQDTNRARVNHDRKAYETRRHLREVAQQWAEWMARHQTVRHNPYLTTQVRRWRDIGENVGRGASESVIHRAFMDSSSHRSNILSGTYTQFAVGVARSSDGTLYVDQIFRRPR